MAGYRTLRPQKAALPPDGSKKMGFESKQLATARDVADASKMPTGKVAGASAALSKNPDVAPSKLPVTSKAVSVKSAAVTSKVSTATSSAMPTSYAAPQLFVNPLDMPNSVGPTKKGDTIKMSVQQKQAVKQHDPNKRLPGGVVGGRPHQHLSPVNVGRHGQHIGSGHHRGLHDAQHAMGQHKFGMPMHQPPSPPRAPKSRKCLVICLFVVLFVLIVVAIGLVVGLKYGIPSTTTATPAPKQQTVSG